MPTKKSPRKKSPRKRSKSPVSRTCYRRRGLMSSGHNVQGRCYRSGGKMSKRLRSPQACDYPDRICRLNILNPKNLKVINTTRSPPRLRSRRKSKK